MTIWEYRALELLGPHPNRTAIYAQYSRFFQAETRRAFAKALKGYHPDFGETWADYFRSRCDCLREETGIATSSACELSLADALQEVRLWAIGYRLESELTKTLEHLVFSDASDKDLKSHNHRISLLCRYALVDFPPVS